jgi:hypothetical protein
MSNYSTMSDEELNEAIAIKTGWSRYTHHDENGLWDEWYTPRGKPSIYNQIPKYIHSWELAGEMLEEMRASLCFDSDTGLWECEYFTQYGEDEIHRFVRANTPQRAICEAWLAWKELE